MRKRKRGNSEGTIFFHKAKGLWCGQVSVGRGADGKLKRYTIYGKTRQEVATKLAELSLKAAKGLLPTPEAITFAEWANLWLERKAKEARPKTAHAYRYDLAPLIREIGHLRLQAIRPHHLRAAFDRLRDGGLSRRGLREALMLARAIFREALKVDLIMRNPAEAVEVSLPKASPVGKVLLPEQVPAFLEAAKEERLYPALFLILTTGLRRGEVCGLKWEDVDLEGWRLTVRNNRTTLSGKVLETLPKTTRGFRTIHLSPDAVEVLRAWKRVQEEEREKAQDAWEDTGYVFTNPLGLPIHPDNLNHALRRVCDRAGLPRLRVHDLRHTHATLLLRKGVPVEVVSEKLGHATPAFTLTQYRHILPEERREYALSLADLTGTNRAKA